MMGHPQYRSLYDLPALAGLCSMESAVQAEWSLDQSVRWLKYLHYLLKRLSESLVAKIAAEPTYELKLLYGHHAYLLAEHANAIRKRVSEMREPPLGLERIPHSGLKLVLDELEYCYETQFFVLGCYQVVVPTALKQCRRLQESAHPLADAPTVRCMKLIAFELEEIEKIGQQAIACLQESNSTDSTDSPNDRALKEWLQDLEACLSASLSAVQSNGECEAEASPQLPKRKFSQGTPHHTLTPKRDERFQDPYNGGVNAEAFLYDDQFSDRDKSLMMFYKRIRELDVPETMASILIELREDEPWEFYYDMVRQLWDEARHAMMGEVGFVSLGLDWTKIPINFTWSLNLNTQLDARQRHGVLFFIEQGLMPKTGKRFEWEIGVNSGIPLSALFQDFDWADEVLHSQIGRRWFVPKFDSLDDALNYGDQCWSAVMSHWDQFLEMGLTEHRNWWPDLYREACQKWGTEPDPEALRFEESYRDRRADLKQIDRH